MAFPRRFQPTVSDHAVVRWLERVRGVDIEAIRAEILDQGRGQWAAEGAVYVRVPDLGVSLVADQGRILTIVPHARRSRG
ncbi:hypothetical protein BH10PSE5_BH10PSE5_01480 [soil metagenome]